MGLYLLGFSSISELPDFFWVPPAYHLTHLTVGCKQVSTTYIFLQLIYFYLFLTKLLYTHTTLN